MYSIPNMPDEFERLSVLMRVKLPTASFEQCQRLAQYLAYVREYSAVLNLTGIKDLNRLADELVVEALNLLEIGGIPAGWEAADLGSGNGSPVVPLALLCSEAQFTAIEARERRAAFLERVKTGLGLDNLTVRHARAEDVLAQCPASFDLITSRAFAPPDALLPLAAQLTAPGGEVRGFTGLDIEPLRTAAREAGLAEAKLLAYPVRDEIRHAYVLRKGTAPRTEQVIY